MPVVPPPPSSSSTINQIVLTGPVASTQKNFRQMQGSVQEWNPDCPSTVVASLINDAYRRVIDHRLWYGLSVKGQIPLPTVYSTGTVSVTNGLGTVTGIGTAFTSDMVGRTFRVGRTTYVPYIISSVTDPTHLELDMPWNFQTYPSTGYSIFKNIVSLGPNIKFIKAAYNPSQGWKMYVNVPADVITALDPWRAAIGQVMAIASYVPSSTGEPQFEIYPVPITQQAIPYIAYIQPPDLKQDSQTPYTFIRSDIIELAAKSMVLLFRGKESKYYDPNTAAYFEKLFQAELSKMERNDDNHALVDLRWEWDSSPWPSPGMDWQQTHEDVPW